MNDIEASLLAEHRSLQRQLEAKEAEFEKLTKSLDAPRNYRRNRRYSVELAFQPFTDTPIRAQQGSFTVDKDTRFNCGHLEASIRITGTAAGSSQTMCIPIAEAALGFAFDYRIYDSGSDREWQSMTAIDGTTTSYIPGDFLLSGLLAPLALPKEAILAGGSEVIVDVVAGRASNSLITEDPAGDVRTIMIPVKTYTLQISFIGFEDKS